MLLRPPRGAGEWPQGAGEWPRGAGEPPRGSREVPGVVQGRLRQPLGMSTLHREPKWVHCQLINIFGISGIAMILFLFQVYLKIPERKNRVISLVLIYVPQITKDYQSRFQCQESPLEV